MVVEQEIILHSLPSLIREINYLPDFPSLTNDRIIIRKIVRNNVHKKNECEGRDLNPRTPSGTDLESVSVDQA